MLSIVQQIEAARPHFLAPKIDGVKVQRPRTYSEQVLAALPKKNGITTAEIMETVDIHKSMISECLKELKAAGKAKNIGMKRRFALWVRV